jgi:hypothetical protein
MDTGDQPGPSKRTGPSDEDVANLQEKAARALKSLKSFKEEIAREHRQNFATYAYSSDKGKRPRFGKAPAAKRYKHTNTPWTHHFVCLASCDKCKPPTSGWEREMLIEAGLGEKKIYFSNIDCSAEEYRDKLIDAFPKLREAGGFEMMRCSANARVLEHIAPSALQSPRSTHDRVGRSKVYIRPIQKDLDITPVETASTLTNTVRT